MIPFLSDEGERRHKEYVEGLKRRLNFLYKSCEELRCADVKVLKRIGGSSRGTACEVLALRAEILLHGVYFSSFSGREYPPSRTANESFGSGLGLLNELKRAALSKGVAFVGVFWRDGRLRVFSVRTPEEIFGVGEPILAIDMSEHAYFLEFGFMKEDYLARALAYLNLSMLDENK